MEGVEPSHTVPETAVLPLDDTPPRVAPQESDAKRYIIGIQSIRQERKRTFSKDGYLGRKSDGNKRLLIQLLFESCCENAVMLRLVSPDELRE